MDRAQENSGKREILFLTGTRAEFGKLKPLIQQVKDSDLFEYSIFATGMHMLSRYGSTVIEIQRAGFANYYPFINQDGAINSQMDLVLANTIQGLGHYIREFTPDLIVVHGDRIEALAGAIVGAINNILVAHIEGGEVSGTVDELLRHAVSKMSHIHFVANDEARQRLLQMGEADNSVFVIGSPDIDVMLSDDLPTILDIKSKYEISFERYGILIFHPVTTEVADLDWQSAELVEALLESTRNFVVILPNNDHGSDIIQRCYAAFDSNARFRVIPSMRFEYFLSLLKHADVIVGNSSAGIREAPVYGIPTINIGNRQLNRFQYESIVNTKHQREAILAALETLPNRITPSLHFGSGNSASLFLAHLSNPTVWQLSRQKQFTDLQTFTKAI